MSITTDEATKDVLKQFLPGKKFKPAPKRKRPTVTLASLGHDPKMARLMNNKKDKKK